MDIKTLTLLSAVGILSSVLTFFINNNVLAGADAESSALVVENEAIMARLVELEKELEKASKPRRFELAPARSAVLDRKPAPAPVKVERPTEGKNAEQETDSATAAEAGTKQKRVKELLARLDDPNLTVDQKQALWRRLAAEGGADDLIAALTKSRENDPDNPDLATDLGSAYVAKMRSGQVTPLERRELTRKAMGEFDRALELDDEHWEARFSKSMMQVFAPAALGLQSAAKDNLDLLLEQQRRQPQQPEHAHTYFFLANLYANQGKTQESAALRLEAAGRFPDDKRFQ